MKTNIKSHRPSAHTPALLAYVDPESGSERAVPATDEGARTVPFEQVTPIRRIPMYRGQMHTPGWFWSSTTQHLLEYETYLEKRWLYLYDFDARVVGMSTQMFEIRAIDLTGPVSGYWEHVPDIFLRMADGAGEVIDVKHPVKFNDPEVTRQRKRMETLCADMGFGYRMVTEPEPVIWRNVAFLAHYRRPLPIDPAVRAHLLATCRNPVRICDVVDPCDKPPHALGVLLALCWRHELVVDLTTRLDELSLVQTSPELAEEAMA